LANKILQGVVYTLSPNDPLDLFRPPGYPAFLAVIIRIFGANPGTIAFVQLVVSTATGYLLFILVRSRYTKETVYLVFSLYLMDPITIIWGLKILSETLFTFLMFLSFYFIDLWRRKGRNYLLLLSGLVIALGTLTRPIGQAIIYLILGFILFRPVDSTIAKRRLSHNLVPAFSISLWMLNRVGSMEFA
jgi:4-amino-4-deoxy-L-arabinose transferase-like glycosyltransferase